MGNCLCIASGGVTGTPAKPKGRKKKSRGKKKSKPNKFQNDGYYFSGSSKVLVFKGVKEGDEVQTKYTLGRELGRGEFGITYLCRDKETQELLACKSISKKKLRTAVDVEDVRREVAVMNHLPKHDNIVCLKGVHQDEAAVHLVMELCEGGELFDRIIDRGHYTEREAANVTRTIVEVVLVCHKNRVMHRDLKPENFLFAGKKEDSPLKAIDFGLSCFFTPGERFSEIVGSPYYMAPEVLKRNYGPEIDVWSAGVILYILLCGVPPFWAETEQGVALAILRGALDFSRDPWPKVSDQAKSLVRHMLEPDPKLRYTAKQVMEHPWLQDGKKVGNAQLGDAVKSRLKQFSAMNKLKKKALRIIAEHLSSEEIEGLRETFQLMDSDNSGALTFEELKAGLQKIGSQLADSEIRLLMEAADVDGNGSLDYGEFVAASIHLQKMDKEEHLMKAFNHFDRNGSGYIDIDELRLALADDVGPNDPHDFVVDIMREVDLDKDGQISYDEFASMMRTGTDWRKASRRYSRELFNSLSTKLFQRDGSLTVAPRPTTYSLRERR